MSFIIGTHFCGGEAIETKIMLGKTHLGCGMMDIDLSCEDSGKTGNHPVRFNNLPCCENEFQIIQVTEEFVKDAILDSFNVDFAAAFLATLLNGDLIPNSTIQFYTDYSPPPLEKDVQVLFQTFLI
ncbi:MAG: hypothetical protein IH594_16015 [Bacteroidales bacterium]|nr:hypothetical protein [Bacteroidales bacterium]